MIDEIIVLNTKYMTYKIVLTILNTNTILIGSKGNNEEEKN